MSDIDVSDPYIDQCYTCAELVDKKKGRYLKGYGYFCEHPKCVGYYNMLVELEKPMKSGRRGC